MENKNIDNKQTELTGIYSNDDGTVQNYFQFYSKLLNQQNMLQDYVRTSTVDFVNKRVMDLGTGSGILAIFASAAGADKVYAVEASNSINYAEQLIKFHNFDKKITLINKKIEDMNYLEKENKNIKVDTLISEPLGVLLVNERGKMYPSSSDMYFIPFCDESLYKEQISKVSFWDNSNFFGLNMQCLKEEALKEKFRQPIIDVYDPSIHIAETPCKYLFDFYTIKYDDLLNFTIDLEFTISKATLMHGISCWFDAMFDGSNEQVVLSTSPYSNPTHWYQVRLLLPEPLAINKNQKIVGSIRFEANSLQSYYIHLKIGISKLNIWIENTYDLKDPEFRGFTGYINRNQNN